MNLAGPGRVDERLATAGTTLRFVLLVVLLLVGSGKMIVDIVEVYSDTGGYGCALAAGADPSQGTLRILLAIEHQTGAFKACVARYQPPPPWWLTVAWPALVLAAATVLFFVLPIWRLRSGRVVALDIVDSGDALRESLASLVATAGLVKAPHFVVDPTASSTGAVVFGSTRRPTVCLHGGLLVRESTDPKGFRAVLLHELAHIRNGDITITYITVAVWRVFLVAVLLPYAALYTASLAGWHEGAFSASDAPLVTRSIVLTVLLVGLAYLARADVLRTREVYADRLALRWGADPVGWAASAPSEAGGRSRRAFRSFIELWRTHPRWDLRRDALADPSMLFGARALPMILTGTAAMLLNGHLGASVTGLGWSAWWIDLICAVATAALPAGVAGVVLWRAVTYGVLTGRSVPSGVLAGLWLGCGMVIGELVMNRVAITDWLPSRPEVLLLVVLAGAVFAWWTARCALVWATTWRGRTFRPAMLLTLATAWLALSSFFAWWQTSGGSLAFGWSVNTAGVAQLLTRWMPGPAVHDSATMAAIAAAYGPLYELVDSPLLVAAWALWMVPLLAWTIRQRPSRPAWMHGYTHDVHEAGIHAERLPPLRWALVPGLIGGFACWAAILVAQKQMLAVAASSLHQSYLDLWVYLAWLLVASAAGTAVAAIAASVAPGRFRLFVVLIAAGTATLIGLAGIPLLVSENGCIPPYGKWLSCGWYAATTPWTMLQALLGPALVIGVLVALAVAMLVAVFSGLGRRHTPPSEPTRSSVLTGRGLLARRLCVAALCAASAAATATAAHFETRAYSGHADPGAEQLLLKPANAAPVSAQIRTWQVEAWIFYGGKDLTLRYATIVEQFGQELSAVASAGGYRDLSRFRPLCAALEELARDADGYFRVPDLQLQQLWRKSITEARDAGKGCVQAVGQRDEKLVDTSISELNAGAATLEDLVGRMAVMAENK